MATEKLVTEQFQLLGVEVQKEVLKKCVSLCNEYNLDAETFVDQWTAFSLTHLDSEPPTLEKLHLLERKEFSKRAADKNNAPTNDKSTGSSLTVYGASKSTQPENEIISNYMAETPKRIKVETESISNQSELRPVTYSPSIGHSDKFAARTNAGSVVHSYGDESLLQNISKPNNPSDVLSLNIRQVPNHNGDLYAKAMFGFEMLHEKVTTFDDHIQYISQCIMKKADISDVTSVRHKSQNDVWVCGRMECDADARLNPKSVVVQGTWTHSLSQAVPVDLDQVKQYSLFPGQVVVMRGTNPHGDRFIAHEVYYDAAEALPDRNADIMNTLTGTMSIVMAAGPYTASDNMTYEPFKELITYISAHRPHVVILTGPFMDCEHSKIKDNTMAETYNTFFDKLMDSLGELNTTSPYTKVYIVSSSRDSFHVNIYPTPAYGTRRRHPHVHFVPDPCTLNISGVLLGVTSTDVLMHISQEEISLGMGGDKLARLASHVLSQKCYYPLCPPTAGLAVDSALWDSFAQLPCTPHILVLPSNFRYFVKEVNGCVVVNPEHLTKGTGGGTFARMTVTDDGVAAQIVRI